MYKAILLGYKNIERYITYVVAPTINRVFSFAVKVVKSACMNNVRKTHETDENRIKMMKRVDNYENRMKSYENCIENYENCIKNYEKRYQKL